MGKGGLQGHCHSCWLWDNLVCGSGRVGYILGLPASYFCLYTQELLFQDTPLTNGIENYACISPSIHLVTNHYIAKVVAKCLSIKLFYIVSIPTKGFSHPLPMFPLQLVPNVLAHESEAHILQGEACEAAPL